MQRITVVGTGYVGTVTATCLAWLGHEVSGLDADPKRAGQLQSGQLPFYEPRLQEMLANAMQTGRLRFVDRSEDALTGADVVFLCVGTPRGTGGQPNLSQLKEAARAIAGHLRDDVVVVNKSTVPVGAGNWVRTLLQESLPRAGGPRFSVVSNPEFLREGSAIDDFLYPDRIVLGGRDDACAKVAQVYRRVLLQDFDGGRPTLRPELIVTELPSAEMIKYAANAFLATKISFANEISSLCELVGADARQVLPAIGSDTRIGRQFLQPGIGWGGSCLGKDVTALIATGLEYGYNSSLLRATVEVNQSQRAAVFRKLQVALKVLKGKRITLLGLAFKPRTDDLRDAPALEIADRLLAAGAFVSAYDPVVKELPEQLSEVRLGTDPYDAADRADAVVLMTEWAEFGALDFQRLAGVMAGNVIVDGRNALSTSDATAAGLKLVGMGR
jgi:nucleotide sugar dehydrogenase